MTAQCVGFCSVIGSWYVEPQNVEQGMMNIEAFAMQFMLRNGSKCCL
jgi:hypothetical protein